MSGLPFEFDVPGEAVLDRLRDEFGQLPIIDDAQFVVKAEGCTSGDLDECLKRIDRHLQDDFAENCAEVSSVPWTFAYRAEVYLAKDTRPDLYGIAVLTRLISPNPGDGNILYGPVVFRTGVDRFIVRET